MIYIVSGHVRSGTSSMMHILNSIGIQPYFDEEREDILKKTSVDNPYFYESTKIIKKNIDPS